MLSKAQIQLAQRLQQKKFRQEEKLFLAEGTKIVGELLQSDFKIHSLFALSDWIKKNESNPLLSAIKCTEVTEMELKKLSALSTPNEVICLVHQRESIFPLSELKNKLSLALCDIQDPGNFGTILRIADWYGIENIFCSLNTVDLYNPKVIQASMGSFLRTKVQYYDLETLLTYAKEHSINSYGALLQGDNLYQTTLSKTGILVMGNESKGISEKLVPFIDKKLSIPSFAAHPVDSLNVSIATAIFCSEFKRN